MPKATVYMKHIVSEKRTVEVSGASILVAAKEGVLLIHDRAGTNLFAAPVENVNHIEIDLKAPAD